MASKKRVPPGAKKGVPKAHAHPLTQGFSDRLLAAMRRAGLVREDQSTKNAELGRWAECTHQVIGQYLTQPRTTIDAVLLLKLCDALSVTPYWLAQNDGTVDDLAIGKRPMEEFRKKKSAPMRLIEETSGEVHS